MVNASQHWMLRPSDPAVALPAFFVARRGLAGVADCEEYADRSAWHQALTVRHPGSWVAVRRFTDADAPRVAGEFVEFPVALDETVVILVGPLRVVALVAAIAVCRGRVDDVALDNVDPVAAIICAHLNGSYIGRHLAHALRIFSGRWGVWGDRIIQTSLASCFTYGLVKATRRQFGVDRWTLRRRLTLREGVTPSRLLRAMRTAVSASLAWETDESASWIAHSVQLADERPLNSACAAVFGSTFALTRRRGRKMTPATRQRWLVERVDEYVHRREDE